MPTLTQTSGCKECVVNLHISRRGEGGYAIHSNVNWVICWEYHQKLNINLSEGTPKGLVLHAVRGPQFLPGPLNWVLLFSALHPPPHISFMPNITLPYFSSYDFLPNPTMYFFSLGQKIWLLSSNPHILASIWHIQCSKDIWSSDSEWIRRYQFSFFDSNSQLWSFGWNLNAVHRVTIHPWLPHEHPPLSLQHSKSFLLLNLHTGCSTIACLATTPPNRNLMLNFYNMTSTLWDEKTKAGTSTNSYTFFLIQPMITSSETRGLCWPRN